MKLIEAITRIDRLKHNTYEKSEKIRWLSVLDGLVKAQIMDKHADGAAESFAGYDPDTPDDTQLLVPAPYDELYLWWLASQIDYYNGELTRYNNSIELFNTGYEVYAQLYTQKHKPLTAADGFF